MKRVSPIIGVVVAAGLLGACQKHEDGTAPSTTAGATGSASHEAASGIAWFQGDVPAAFEKARVENKPVFLYWGAEWCPYCKDLKANVFSRQDFIEKSRLFVPVYLDGDSAGAQKWGDEFGISGYPTVIVLRANRTELARIGGGMDRNQYAEVLDLVLGDTKPVNILLTAMAAGGTSLSADDCRRLAYNGWNLDDATMKDSDRLALGLQKAAELCPANARIERTRLTEIATSAAAASEAEAIEAGQMPSARLRALTDEIQKILADRPLATATADALQYLDENFFVAVKKMGADRATKVLQQWNEVMDAIAADTRYTAGDRLSAVRNKLVAAKSLSADGKIPPALAADAKKRVEEALAGKYDAFTRAGLVNAALNTLDTLGEQGRAYEVAEAEMKESKTPYYYMSDLGSIEEKRGNKEAALKWFERAYRESKGAATRFQWGTSYVNALIRIAPQDSAKIQKAAIEVLGELDGPDRLYKRTRARLDKLDANLQKWNAAGAHDKSVVAIRGRMGEICDKIPANEAAAKETCQGFLSAKKA